MTMEDKSKRLEELRAMPEKTVEQQEELKRLEDALAANSNKPAKEVAPTDNTGMTTSDVLNPKPDQEQKEVEEKEPDEDNGSDQDSDEKDEKGNDLKE